MENDLIFLNMNEKDENLEIRRFVGCCHYMSSHGSENRKLSPFLGLQRPPNVDLILDWWRRIENL